MATTQQPWLKFEQDPCRRAGDNPESADAFRRSEPVHAARRQQVFELIRKSGEQGMTLLELCEAIGRDEGRVVNPNALSGRLTELHERRLIYRKGAGDGRGGHQRRDGAAVWWAVGGA